MGGPISFLPYPLVSRRWPFHPADPHRFFAAGFLRRMLRNHQPRDSKCITSSKRGAEYGVILGVRRYSADFDGDFGHGGRGT